MSKNEAAGRRAATAPSTEKATETPSGASDGTASAEHPVVKVLRHGHGIPDTDGSFEDAPQAGGMARTDLGAGDAEPGGYGNAGVPEDGETVGVRRRINLRATRDDTHLRSPDQARIAPIALPGDVEAPAAGSAARLGAAGDLAGTTEPAPETTPMPEQQPGAEPAVKTEAEKQAARERRRARRAANPQREARRERRRKAKTSKLNVSPRRAGEAAYPVMPTAPVATRKKRHVGVLLSFLLLVALPCGIVAWYLFERAADQYASNMGFSVHKEDASSASEMLTGGLDFIGGDTSDTDILYEYIQSQALVQRIDSRIDLRSIYSKPDNDWYFTIAPDAPIEDLVRYWRRMVTIYYDTGSGLIETRVLAFTPEDAQQVSRAIFDESSATINKLTSIAREDATKYARDELGVAEDRLRDARKALTEFRARTQIVDPSIDVQGQMGLLTTLQAQLADALIELDLLRDNTREGDPRIRQAEQRIAVIENRIADERSNFGVGDTGPGSKAYASLVGEYETLTVDREFAEQTYLAAQANLDAAQAEAQRQSRYLAAYAMPTLAESSEYPQRLTLLGVFALFSIGAWSVGALIYYSIRDRR